jgi:hypothetical protein
MSYRVRATMQEDTLRVHIDRTLYFESFRNDFIQAVINRVLNDYLSRAASPQLMLDVSFSFKKVFDLLIEDEIVFLQPRQGLELSHIDADPNF